MLQFAILLCIKASRSFVVYTTRIEKILAEKSIFDLNKAALKGSGHDLRSKFYLNFSCVTIFICAFRTNDQNLNVRSQSSYSSESIRILTKLFLIFLQIV